MKENIFDCITFILAFLLGCKFQYYFSEWRKIKKYKFKHTLNLKNFLIKNYDRSNNRVDGIGQNLVHD